MTLPPRLLLAMGLLLLGPHLARADEPILFVEDRAVLSRLEQLGFAFGSLFGESDARDLAALHARSSSYRTMVATVAGDLEELRTEVEAGGRTLSEFVTGETGRIMDTRWLSTQAANFRLVGVVNRIDRRDFQESAGERSCGEVRLIYRLAYSFRREGRGKLLSSRMPFSLNAVFDVPHDSEGGCEAAAARWNAPDAHQVDAERLSAGPLAKGAAIFRQLELNAQVIRFPSGQEPEFGGQAVYLMRIFRLEADGIGISRLENQPDVKRLSADDVLRNRLAAYIKGNAAAIDEGVYRIPEEFLAEKAISWSTFGGARAANHPFLGLFKPEEFASLAFDGMTLIRSPRGLLARLDNGTCQGCHQSGGTAGFHFLGLDDASTSPLNRIEVGVSAHFHADLPRRRAWLDKLRRGAQPERFRPLSTAPAASWEGQRRYEPAEAGMACVAVADQDAIQSGWGCVGDTVCTTIATPSGDALGVAQCLLPKDSGRLYSGHPCLAGEVTASGSQPFKDRFRLKQFAAFAPKASHGDYTCRPPRIGVPGGLAYRRCDADDRRFSKFTPGEPSPREICGLTGGKAFDLCVATGNFDQCLAGAVQRGNRAACSADQFCRDDYICQAFPPDTPNVKKVKGTGFCSPTYFLFQMRIDNHTTPWKRPRRSILSGTVGRAETPLYRSVEVGPGEDPDGQW